MRNAHYTSKLLESRNPERLCSIHCSRWMDREHLLHLRKQWHKNLEVKCESENHIIFSSTKTLPIPFRVQVARTNDTHNAYASFIHTPFNSIKRSRVSQQDQSICHPSVRIINSLIAWKKRQSKNKKKPFLMQPTPL